MSEDLEKIAEDNDRKKYENWNTYRNVKDIWECIDSPQFLDFNEITNHDLPYLDQFGTPKWSSQNKKQTENVPSPNPDDEVADILLSGLSLTNEKQEEHSHRSNGATINLNQPSTSKHPSEKKTVHNQQKTGNRHCTKLSPFSFDAQNKRMLERKEERMKKMLEEERKMFPVFYAKPVPRYIKARAQKSHSEIACNPSSTVQDPVPSTKVKKTKPRSPVLHTARRARQRAQFDNAIKQREVQSETAKKLEEENAKKMEQRQIAKFRKQLIHKANPVRSYQQLPPREKRPLTEPMTPFCIKRRRFH
ncbi:targeting protein for Xklp2-like isoform X2 [Cephus cinctus]|uniref:Targeting protein for Xklp2-like isoform X2 n=1 Tax=Cephus cinctus TaxID=211228 RepID=A0AAJ7CGD6_CEPCN|nr:targeting protein for Xklp2-like isoform X2 [Cephus cinctus]